MQYLDYAVTLVVLILLVIACAPASRFQGRQRFRIRRTRNWFLLGSVYACYYLCRHNLGVANKGICDEFGFTRQQFGWIITASFWAYAVGQCVNGFFADRIGGKRSMLLGAAGTVVLNAVFGAASFWGMLGVFIAVRLLDGYMQSMGAPGMVKLNAAWFSRPERGGFAGIFGFMIQMGQMGIQRFIGPLILTGVLTFGYFDFTMMEPQHWRWLFWIPSIITAGFAVLMALFVRSTPEAAGFREVRRDESGKSYYEHESEGAFAMDPETADEHEPAPLPAWHTLKTILSHPGVWFCAVAYFCTGFVRYGVLNWYLRFLEDFGIGPNNAIYKGAALAVTLAAILGSLGAGFLSDIVFKGRRAPVAAGLYLVETIIILASAVFIYDMNARVHRGEVTLNEVTAGDSGRKTVEVLDAQGQRLDHMPGIHWAVAFMVLVALTCNSTHSIIGTAAAMDIGGRRMSGFSSGVIDSFQYFGGGLTGFFVGGLIDQYGYTIWMLSMAPAGLLGAVCMLIYRRREKEQHHRETGR